MDWSFVVIGIFWGKKTADDMWMWSGFWLVFGVYVAHKVLEKVTVDEYFAKNCHFILIILLIAASYKYFQSYWGGVKRLQQNTFIYFQKH